MSQNVLICDDNDDILEVTSAILQMKGYKISTVTHSDQLMEAIKANDPHVILMDLGIPEIGGEEATKLIKSDESLKHIPVIIFSANHEIEVIAKRAGADDFLAKPFEIQKLENIILKHFKNSSAV